MRAKFASHEDYLATVPEASRRFLEAIRAEVERRVPITSRCIAYSMPALRQRKVFFYFAAFKRHIGIYPPVPAAHPLAIELAPFRGPKGNLSFPLGDPLPLELIGRTAEVLAEAYGG